MSQQTMCSLQAIFHSHFMHFSCGFSILKKKTRSGRVCVNEDDVKVIHSHNTNRIFFHCAGTLGFGGNGVEIQMADKAGGNGFYMPSIDVATNKSNKGALCSLAFYALTMSVCAGLAIAAIFLF